MLVTHYRHYH